MAYRSISTNNAPATGLVVTPPAGIADGDILVAWSLNDASTGATTWPAGFAEGTASPLSMSSFDASTFRYALKIASGESGNYTITGATAIIGGIAAFSGRTQSTTPHKDSGAISDTGNASPYTITSAAFGSATTATCDIIWIATADGTGSNQTFTQPSTYTLDADICQTATFERQFAFAHKDGVASGETGALSGSGAGAAAGWSVFAIALSAASPPAAALSGTVTASITESDIVTGGKTIILTLSDTTWIPS